MSYAYLGKGPHFFKAFFLFYYGLIFPIERLVGVDDPEIMKGFAGLY